MAAKDQVVASEVLQAGWWAAEPAELADLGMPPGGRVVRLVRVRRAGGTPMAVETALLVPRCSFVLDHDLAAGSLHALLAEQGIVPTEAFGTLRAEPATAQDAERLAVVPGSPLLVERRRIDDQHGARVESTETRYAGDRYVFDVHLRRPHEG
jgi:GntR family transcriptional regulator